VEKVDYLKQFKHLYAQSARSPEIVDVPQMNFFMIDGKGDPNTSQEFAEAVEALFSLSYNTILEYRDIPVEKITEMTTFHLQIG